MRDGAKIGAGRQLLVGASREILGEAEDRLRRGAVTYDPRVKVECRDLFETPPHSGENPFVVISERASAKERQ